MTVSIITIAFNSESCIGATIESVLAQLEAPAEYWIIDGKSSDGTVEKAETYRDAFAQKGISYHVISEPDGGIYDAMNKGIRLAEGELIGILNSGDTYQPEAVKTAVETFQSQKCDLMFADIRIHRIGGGSFVKKARLRKFQTSRDWNHPTTFVRARLYKENPFRDMGIHDDYGFYLQMVRQGRKIVTVDQVLADFYLGGASSRKSLKEAARRIRDRYLYCYRINGYSRWYFVECVGIEAFKFLFG